MYNQDLITLGRQLADFRKSKGLTQQKISQFISIDRQTISNIERGQFTGSLAILLRYLRYAGLELKALPPDSPFPVFEDLDKHYREDDDA